MLIAISLTWDTTIYLVNLLYRNSNFSNFDNTSNTEVKTYINLNAN